jgi:hypothetical protein
MRNKLFWGIALVLTATVAWSLYAAGEGGGEGNMPGMTPGVTPPATQPSDTGTTPRMREVNTHLDRASTCIDDATKALDNNDTATAKTKLAEAKTHLQGAQDAMKNWNTKGSDTGKESTVPGGITPKGSY